MSTAEPPPVLFEVTAGVATITLNRPEQLNAINAELGAGLMDALRQVRTRDDIRAPTFAAGQAGRLQPVGWRVSSGPTMPSGSTSSTRRSPYWSRQWLLPGWRVRNCAVL